MSVVYQWNDQSSNWMLKINSNGAIEISSSYCTNYCYSGFAKQAAGQTMLGMLSGGLYHGWKNSSGTLLMAIAYGTFYAFDGEPRFTCPTLLIRGNLGESQSIAQLNERWGINGVYMWKDANGDPLAVLDVNGYLCLRTTLTREYNWDSAASAYFASDICKDGL